MAFGGPLYLATVLGQCYTELNKSGDAGVKEDRSGLIGRKVPIHIASDGIT
jgi:hypothetical protein